jgi:hypothetical protein
MLSFPASKEDLKLAQILYFQLMQEELPMQAYTQQDIDYIIDELVQATTLGTVPFQTSITH